MNYCKLLCLASSLQHTAPYFCQYSYISTQLSLEHHRMAHQQEPQAATAPPDFFGYTFALENEDHTLANSLRFFLNKNPNVSFCGYSMPHPSEEVANVRVQTTGSISAAKALRAACEDLQDVTKHMSATFDAAVKEFKQQQAGPMET